MTGRRAGGDERMWSGYPGGLRLGSEPSYRMTRNAWNLGRMRRQMEASQAGNISCHLGLPMELE